MPVVGGVETAKSGLSALYLDVHEFGPGNVSAKAVAEAHQKDLAQEAAHGVRFLNYWVDESRGEVFCLSEAPDPESVIATHRAAHGLVPKQVVKVTAGN
ncbi:DUF4242 domain-containing protein [Opitutaceae bacterium EW11]|nr:DUF4242 domain-containing protein [Opitutaceae bacterium EW11]